MSFDIIGKKIGNYEVIEKIGLGGMGTVYKGIHSALDRVVALKMINPELVNNPEVIGRFYNEAKIHAKLSHPNIVIVYDFIKQNSNYYIVMEYVKGESVGNIIKEQGPFDIKMTINIINQVLSGISHAHKKGIIHRDVKPNNFILTPTLVKITDFGIAHIISETGYTVDGSMLGTPKYMSPEQIMGGTVDHRSDIYSLGISMYEMLTGHVPFESEFNSDFEVKKGHVEHSPPSMRKYIPDMPKEIEEIIFKSLEKKPEDRYQSALEMIEALNKYSDTDLTVRIDNIEEVDANLTSDGNQRDMLEVSDLVYDDEGVIEEHSIAYIISIFYKERRSGILTIESDIQMKIYFIKGYIVYVEGYHKKYALAELLVDKSLITKEDQQSALTFANEMGLKIGEALIKMGKISPHELSEILETQIKKKLIHGINISSGKYYYQDTQSLNLEVIYNINPLQAIYDSVPESVVDKSPIYKKIYNGNTIIKLNADVPSELSKIKLNSPKEIKLANVMKNDETVSDLLQKSPLNRDDTQRLLFFMKLSDLIDLENEESDIDIINDKQITKNTKQSNDRTDRMSAKEIEEYKLLTEKN